MTKARMFEGILTAYKLLHEENVLLELSMDDARAVVIEMLIDLTVGDVAHQELEEEELVVDEANS